MTRRQRAAAALWPALLVVYVLAGTALTPFHGDEAMQLHSSGDFTTVFVERNPSALGIDIEDGRNSTTERRLLQGTVNSWAIGLTLHLAGYGPADLPPAPGWHWNLDYEENIALGMRPSEDLLLLTRQPSAWFFAMSVPVFFAIAWRYGGLLTACLAGALYTLHPALLLNGRRAMMEGPMLFFGLLTILCAQVIIRQGHAHRRRWWLVLALVGGLALASKHSAVLFLAGALVWLWFTVLLRRNRRLLLKTTLRCAFAALLALAVFLMLSPALWPDPPGLLLRLLQTRSELVHVQVEQWQPGSLPMTAAERIEQLLVQPFLQGPMFHEVAHWSGLEVTKAETDAWLASPLSGWQPTTTVGLALSLLTLVGLALTLRRPDRVGLPAWLALTLVALMFNPLPWQRYYLPLLPITILLAASGMAQLSETGILVIKRRYKLP